MTDEVKQRVEAFMGEYFQAKIDMEKKYQQMRVPYRNQFYCDDCLYDSHQGTLAKLQSETILEIHEDATEVLVVTRQIANTSRGSVEMVQRYHLRPFNDKWRIPRVDMHCLACHGKDPKCFLCKGVYWLDDSSKK